MHKANKGRGSLRARIAALAALCWLIPTAVLGIYINTVLSSTLREKTEQTLISSASHAQELVVQEIENVLAKSKEVTYDGQFYGIVDEYRAGEQTYDRFFVSARAAWQKLFQRDRLYAFTAFFLLDEPANILYTGDSVDSLLGFEKDVQPSMLQMSEALDTRSRFLSVDGTLYHVRNLVDRRLQRFGMIALGISPQRLLSPMLTADALWYGSVDIVLDDYQSVTNDLPLDTNDFRTGLYEAGDSLYYGQQIKTSDYTFSYRMRVDKAAVYGEADGHFLLTLLLALLAVPVALLAAWYAHRSVLAPLRRLADALSRAGAENEPGPAVALSGHGEAAALAEAYNAMHGRMQLQLDRAQKGEITASDARIAAMQARLTLRLVATASGTLEERARETGDAVLVDMLERLDALLLSARALGEKQTAPLSEELRIGDAALYFLRQQYGQRIAIQQEIDQNLRFLLVPRLCVVMMLESAVEMCVAPCGGGTLRLRVFAQGGAVCIDVHSRGKQWTEDGRRAIRQRLDGETTAPGANSIDARLKRLYGEGAGLSASIGEEGLTAAITIPFGEAQEPEGVAP